MTTIIAIDPGASGGLAWNSYDEGVQACAMPREEVAVINLIRNIWRVNAEAGNRVVAYMEAVTGYVAKPKGAFCPSCKRSLSKDEPGSRMFTFGRGVGVIAGAVHMLAIELHEVSPRTWQKPFYLNMTNQDGSRKTRAERKRVLHDAAQRRFPGLQVTLKTDDALLIHAYGMALEASELPLNERNGSGLQDVPMPFTEAFGPQFGELKQAAVNGTEVLPGDGNKLFIADWKGKPYVFAEVEQAGAILIGPADASDLVTLPRHAVGFDQP